MVDKDKKADKSFLYINRVSVKKVKVCPVCISDKLDVIYKSVNAEHETNEEHSIKFVCKDCGYITYVSSHDFEVKG